MAVMSEPAMAQGVVEVSHHLLYLQDDGAEPEPPFAPRNGLLMAAPGVAVVCTGASSGAVMVEVQVHTGVPADDPAAGWDEVVRPAWWQRPGGWSYVVRCPTRRPGSPC
jgi:hypothetical protein